MVNEKTREDERYQAALEEVNSIRVQFGAEKLDELRPGRSTYGDCCTVAASLKDLPIAFIDVNRSQDEPYWHVLYKTLAAYDRHNFSEEASQFLFAYDKGEFPCLEWTDVSTT